MRNRKKYCVPIVSNIEIAPEIYEMVFIDENIAKTAQAGQFINMYCSGESRILPRPISICEVNSNNSTVKVVYAILGGGTKEFSKLTQGEFISILGPLGRGFEIGNAKEHIIIGGGVGTPPLLELVKRLEGKKTVYLGFRTSPYLTQEFEKYADVMISTEDGSVGCKGTVIELLKEPKLKNTMVYACGPNPMLKAIKNWSTEKGLQAQLSLEERMGCGIGACVGCTCKIKEDTELGYAFKKVCVDGPVFLADEVLFD